MGRVGDEPPLSGVCVANGAQGPCRQDPRDQADQDDDEQVSDEQRDPDPVEGGLICGLRRLLVRELGREVECRREDGRERDVEHETERGEDKAEQNDVQNREPDSCLFEHQPAPPDRTR